MYKLTEKEKAAVEEIKANSTETTSPRLALEIIGIRYDQARAAKEFKQYTNQQLFINAMQLLESELNQGFLTIE